MNEQAVSLMNHQETLSLVAHLATALHWPPHIQLVPVISNSMAPTVNVGDIVAVDTDQRELWDGVYLFQFGDSQVLRRVQIVGGGRVLLGWDNRVNGNPQEFDVEEARKLVCGRAIFAEKRF